MLFFHSEFGVFYGEARICSKPPYNVHRVTGATDLWQESQWCQQMAKPLQVSKHKTCTVSINLNLDEFFPSRSLTLNDCCYCSQIAYGKSSERPYQHPPCPQVRECLLWERSSVYATVVTISQQKHQTNSGSCPGCDCPFLCTFWTPADFRLAAAFVPLCPTAGAPCKQEGISQQFTTWLPTCQVHTNACPDYPKLFTISGYHHISKIRAPTCTTKGL